MAINLFKFYNAHLKAPENTDFDLVFCEPLIGNAEAGFVREIFFGGFGPAVLSNGGRDVQRPDQGGNEAERAHHVYDKHSTTR